MRGEQNMIHEEHRHEEHVVREVSRRNDYFLGGSILVAALLIVGALIYTVGLKATGTGVAPLTPVVSATPEIVASDVILGDAKAPVTLFEYADFQCPFCARFNTQTAPQVRDVYVKTGKVNMIYRDFSFLGPESLAAAEAARCAVDQAKFWEYHDAIYNAELKDGQENNGNLNRDLFIKLASQLGMNVSQFTACVDQKKYEALVLKSIDEAKAYGVGSTPTLFVNKTMVVGAVPFATLQQTIEAELKK